MNRDANYWRRRMGLPEEHEGNVGAGTSTSGNVGAPAGGSGDSSGNVGMGVTAPTPPPAATIETPKRRASKPTVGNVGSSGNVGVGSTS